jgi:hypothetical protein
MCFTNFIYIINDEEIKMFSRWFGNDEQEEQKVEKPKPKRNFKSTVKDLTYQIAELGERYHEVQSIFLESDAWRCSYDKDITMSIKTYGSSTEVRIYMHKKISKTLVILKTGSYGDFTIDQTVLNTPKIHDDVLLYIEDFVEQLQTKVETSSNELVDMLTLEKNVRMWFRDAEDSVSINPSLKNEKGFKLIRSQNPKYTDYEARLLIRGGDADVKDIMLKYPAADLIEIYDQDDEEYKSHNMETAKAFFMQNI